MNRFVLDCSVAMAWCFGDEAEAYSDRVLEELERGTALVPCLWSLEVANVLLVAERRGRLTEADTTRFLDLLIGLPIVVEEPTTHSGHAILALGRSHRLSAYDAAYLDLAMREGTALATRDRALTIAAADCGIARFGAG